MRIDDLLVKLIPDGEVHLAMDHLLEFRQSGDETDRIARIPVLDQFLDVELKTLSRRIPPNSPRAELQAFDALFRKVVRNTIL